MKEFRKEYLIGYNKKDETILTMELEIKHPRYGDGTEGNNYEFTASYNIGELFNVEERDGNPQDYYNELWDCYSSEQKLDYLQDGEITKDDVINDWIDESYDYRERIDCSCTDYELVIYDETYNFETIGGGQLDEEEISDFNFINKNVSKLINIWINYHLKVIDDDIYNDIISLIEPLEKYNIYNNIEERLEEIFF